MTLELAWNRIEPFLEKRDQGEGCWLFCDSEAESYPQVMVDGWMEATHRIAYRYHKGEPPAEKPIIRHICHTPRCCNPAHLIAGTITDNMRDKQEAGRCHRMIGEKSPRAKIPDAEIMAIYNSDEPRDVLAERYGVWPHMITRIRTGEHSLTQHLPARKFNTSAHFDEARRRAISDGIQRSTKPRKSPKPATYPDRKGTSHPRSKIGQAEALALLHSLESHDEAAARLGVSNRLIRDIRAGRHWATKHNAPLA